jgi:hypothetical protein
MQKRSVKSMQVSFGGSQTAAKKPIAVAKPTVIRKAPVIAKSPLPVPKKTAPSKAYTQMKGIQKTAAKTIQKPTVIAKKDSIVQKPAPAKKSNALGQAGLDPNKYKTPVKKAAPIKKPAPVVPSSRVVSSKTIPSGTSGGGTSGGGISGGGSPSSGGVTTGGTSSTGSTGPGSALALAGLWAKAAGYQSQIDGMLKDGFKYDPQTDAAYKSLEATAQSQAKAASASAMETMNDRGILNSTITSDRLGQIEQSAQDAVTAQIPTLQNQAYQQYANKLGTLNSLWTETLGQANTDRSFTEGQREFDTNLAENKRQFDTTSALNQSQFDWQKSQDTFGNQMDQQNYELSVEKYSLDQAKAYQDTNGINNTNATNGAISELLGAKSSNAALALLQKNASSYYSGGVNFTTLLNAISKRWTGFDKKASASTSVNFSNNSKGSGASGGLQLGTIDPTKWASAAKSIAGSLSSAYKKYSGYAAYTTHLAAAMVKGGFSAGWAPLITEIVKRESGFNPNAKNPTSTAHGYAQFLKSTRSNYEKKYGLSYSNPVNQLVLMMHYVQDRYKTPANALAFWNKNHWY